jgi:hypothetical protein
MQAGGERARQVYRPAMPELPDIARGSLVAIDPATIDRIVAIGPGVAQTHPAAGAAANCDALQQRRTSARRASVSRLIVIDVICQSPLVGAQSS